jgi:GNAT superfamily N-acetyltransferase
MTSRPLVPSTVKFQALTPENWPDLDILFGTHGTYGGCWCMWWRLTSSEFRKQLGRGNKRAMKKIVDSGEVPGILAYVGGQPAGWCSFGPREKFGRLERSPTLRRVDQEPVWSIVCYYVDKTYRGQGLMEKLTRAAIDYAGGQGVKIVEGYPLELTGKVRLEAAFTGIAPLFRQMGFVEVLRRAENRPIMRYFIEKK